MTDLCTTAEIQDRIRILKIEARWQRQLADQARRELRQCERKWPADGLTQIRLRNELEFRKDNAKRFSAEARSLEARIK